jgi:hypothetical protein
VQGEGSNPTNGNSSGNGYSVKDSNTGTNTGTNGHTNGNGHGYSCGEFVLLTPGTACVCCSCGTQVAICMPLKHVDGRTTHLLLGLAHHQVLRLHMLADLIFCVHFNHHQMGAAAASVKCPCCILQAAVLVVNVLSTRRIA